MQDIFDGVGFMAKMLALLACMSLVAMFMFLGSFRWDMYKSDNYQQYFNNGDYIIENYDDAVVKAACDEEYNIWRADITYKTKNDFTVENTDYMELYYFDGDSNLYTEIYMSEGITKEDLNPRWIFSGTKEITGIKIRYYKSYAREIRLHTITAKFTYNGRKYYIHLQNQGREQLIPYIEKIINNIE